MGIVKKKEVNQIKRDWYSNKYQIVLLQKNLFALFTICALIAVVIAIFFVKKITESKSFEPFIIEMEDKTGNIQVVENLTQSSLTADTALKRYFVYNFLKIAEGYNYSTYKEDLVKLGLFTDAKTYRQITNTISVRNPKSPVNVLKNTGFLTIQVKSMVFLTSGSASIRFQVNNLSSNLTIPQQQHFVAFVEFKFTDMKLTDSERFLNPLGFQVIKYKVDKDLIPTK